MAGVSCGAMLQSLRTVYFSLPRASCFKTPMYAATLYTPSYMHTMQIVTCTCLSMPGHD